MAPKLRDSFSWVLYCLRRKRARVMKEAVGASQSPPPPVVFGVIRFANFEVDTRAGELRRGGIKLKLSGQPFEVLLALLDKPGQVVTREELHDKLWSKDTFVDFEHGLNKAINKVRDALGDNAENPRFIETLPRRGYRFLAPVEAERPEQAVSVAAPPSELRIHSLTRGAIAILVAGTALLAVWLRAPLAPPRILRSTQITNDGFPKARLVTDGYRIYFTESPSGELKVAQVSSRGGETTTVEVPFVPSFLGALVSDFSREQSALLAYQRTTYDPPDGSYWLVPVPTGAPRKLSDVLGHDAVWAPNGELLFARGNDFYAAQPDGANPRRLAAAPGWPSHIAFSPDGTRFRFTVGNPFDTLSETFNTLNQTTAIWEARADGSDMHPLFPGWHSPPAECCGAWTPDGRYYVFQSYQDRAWNIWVVRERSSWWKNVSRGPVQLTTGPSQFSYPLPSKDGKELFVVGTQPRAELVRYDTKFREFVPFMGGISAGDVDFSKDGQWVTYVSYPDYTLWRSKPDGSDRLRLTSPPLVAALAHWSPDGQQIAFAGTVMGKPWKLFLIPKDGGSPQALTRDEAQEANPAWSPDGTKLAFGHYDSHDPERTFIALFDLKTRKILELPGSQKVFAPDWSPDGRYIIALSFDGQRLMLYDVKNEKWRELSDLKPSSVGYFAWSRDSKYVYLDTILGGRKGYFRMRVSDSRLEQIADLKRIHLFPDLFGSPSESWNGLGPGDTPLFVRDTSAQEIYALDLQLP